MEIVFIELTSNPAFDYFFSIYFTISLILVPIFASIALLGR